jgi:hypothetical protein
MELRISSVIASSDRRDALEAAGAFRCNTSDGRALAWPVRRSRSKCGSVPELGQAARPFGMVADERTNPFRRKKKRCDAAFRATAAFDTFCGEQAIAYLMAKQGFAQAKTFQMTQCSSKT